MKTRTCNVGNKNAVGAHHQKNMMPKKLGEQIMSLGVYTTEYALCFKVEDVAEVLKKWGYKFDVALSQYVWDYLEYKKVAKLKD